jgi:hypothetical protein
MYRCPSFDLSNTAETTEYPEKPLEFICYRPSENLKFKFSEKPLIKPGGFFVYIFSAGLSTPSPPKSGILDHFAI